MLVCNVETSTAELAALPPVELTYSEAGGPDQDTSAAYTLCGDM